MNMSETPEKKKAHLRYDNAFKTAWTDEFHFIKHSRKGNKFAFKMQHNAPFCILLKNVHIPPPTYRFKSPEGWHVWSISK
jgi:predicted alpha-1,6-mannanase (GH76 family)